MAEGSSSPVPEIPPSLDHLLSNLSCHEDTCSTSIKENSEHETTGCGNDAQENAVIARPSQNDDVQESGTGDNNLNTETNIVENVHVTNDTKSNEDINTCDKTKLDRSSVTDNCQSKDLLLTAKDDTMKAIDNCAEKSVCDETDSTSNVDGCATDRRSDDSNCDIDNESDIGEYGGAMLTDLPTELLLLIASYVDSRTIVTGLCQVCQLFNDLFAGDAYWKSRINLRWPKQYPIFEREDFNWQWGCVAREEVHRIWSEPQAQTNHFMFSEGFFAAVDVVHLMKGGRFLGIGSRDRHLNLLDLSKYQADDPTDLKDLLVFSDTKTHKGWVWSMASDDNTLVTGSWDTNIRLWDIGDGDVQQFGQIKLKSAVLDLHYEPGFVAAGGFDRRLMMLDPRSPDVVTIKRYHTQPILNVVADDKYVITGSEDRVIAIYDRAAGKQYKKIEMDSFVMSMSYGDGQLWSGDRQGNLHALDARDGLFDESTMQTFDLGYEGRLTGVAHTDGGVFTCSSDGTLKVIEPSCDPAVISKLTHNGPVSRLSYCNGTLASAGSDVVVGVWMPKY